MRKEEVQNLETKRGLRLLLELSLSHSSLIVSLLVVNLALAFFEGSSIGLFAVAVSVITGGPTLVVPPWLESIGGSFLQEILFIEQSALFIGLVAGGVLLQIAKSGVQYLSARLSIALRFEVTRKLQNRITEKVMSLSYTEIIRRPAGSLSESIRQAESVTVLVSNVNKVIQSIIMLVVYFSLMMIVSLELTFVAFVIVLSVGFGMTTLIRKLKRLGFAIARASIEMERAIIEYLQAPKLLRIFDATKMASDAIKASREIVLNKGRRANVVRALIHPVIEISTILAAGSLLIVGYLVASADSNTLVPKLFLFLLALYRAMPQIRTIYLIKATATILLARLRIVSEILFVETPNELADESITIQRLFNKIEIRGVSFAYSENSTQVLKDISFEIPQGKIIAIVGPSGSGKTTIANLLLKLFQPCQGKILVDGVDLTQINSSSWLGLIGCVEQDVLLFNGTVSENIAFGLENVGRAQIVKAANLAHAAEFIDCLPSEYDTRIGEKGYNLSGGQRQRLALARALVRSPQILILDEATSSLDMESEKLIQNTVRELKQEFTILVIAHRLSTVTNADEIVVIDRGKIAQQGRLQELVETPGIFSDMWKTQFIESDS